MNDRVVEIYRGVAPQRIVGLAYELTLGAGALIDRIPRYIGFVNDVKARGCGLCFVEKSGHTPHLTRAASCPAILERVQMKFRTRVATLAAAATLILVGCSGQAAPAAPEPEPEVLSASEAGGIYLDAVCPVNAAWDAADLALERLRLIASRGEYDTRRFAVAMDEVAAASKKAARELDPKTLDKEGHAWPAAASADIAAVRKSLQADHKQAARVAKLTSSDVLGYSWKGAEEVGGAASAAREALALPADGESACAQWNEQLEAEKAKAEEAKANKKADKTEDSSNDKTGAKP